MKAAATSRIAWGGIAGRAVDTRRCCSSAAITHAALPLERIASLLAAIRPARFGSRARARSRRQRRGPRAGGSARVADACAGDLQQRHTMSPYRRRDVSRRRVRRTIRRGETIFDGRATSRLSRPEGSIKPRIRNMQTRLWTSLGTAQRSASDNSSAADAGHVRPRAAARHAQGDRDRAHLACWRARVHPVHRRIRSWRHVWPPAATSDSSTCSRARSASTDADSAAGGFAYLPFGAGRACCRPTDAARAAVIEKPYEPLARRQPAPDCSSDSESAIASDALDGRSVARSARARAGRSRRSISAVNTMTYQPGRRAADGREST